MIRLIARFRDPIDNTMIISIVSPIFEADNKYVRRLNVEYLEREAKKKHLTPKELVSLRELKVEMPTYDQQTIL